MDLEDTQRHIRLKKGVHFAAVSALRDGQGHKCIGPARLQQLPRQIEAKQGRPGGFFPDEGSRLDYTLGELQQAADRGQARPTGRVLPGRGGRPLQVGLHPWGAAASGKEPEAVGPGETWAAALKRLRAPSLAVLRDAMAASGSKPYIEMVMWFVVHLPLRKRPKVYTEEDTPSPVLEEEVAKAIAALILVGYVVIVGVSSGSLSGGSGSPHGDDLGRGPGDDQCSLDTSIHGLRGEP